MKPPAALSAESGTAIARMPGSRVAARTPAAPERTTLRSVIGSPCKIGSWTMASIILAPAPGPSSMSWARSLAAFMAAVSILTVAGALSDAAAATGPSVMNAGFRASVGQGCQVKSAWDNLSPGSRSCLATRTRIIGFCAGAVTTTCVLGSCAAVRLRATSAKTDRRRQRDTDQNAHPDRAHAKSPGRAHGLWTAQIAVQQNFGGEGG